MKYFAFALIFVLAMTCITPACKKDNYIVGGSLQDTNQYKNTLTYDFLKGNALFDTLCQLIDAAGLKETINSKAGTFFAPTDYAIYSYLSKRTLFVQNRFDQTAKFGLDSLMYYLSKNVANTKDSLLMYMIPERLTNAQLTDQGALIPTMLKGDTAILSYEYTKDANLGYNSLISNIPQLIYYTHLWKHFPLSQAYPLDSLTAEYGIHTLAQSSDIHTQNGVVHVLNNGHTLFFYGTKQ